MLVARVGARAVMALVRAVRALVLVLSLHRCSLLFVGFGAAACQWVARACHGIGVCLSADWCVLSPCLSPPLGDQT